MMTARIKGTLKLVVVVIIALAIGAGAVFALNRPGSTVEPDSVVILKTLGMTCGSCAGKIEKALMGKPGAAEVKVDVEAAQVIASYDSNMITPEALAEAATSAGFKSGIAQNLSMEQYQKLTGRNVSAKAPSKSGGCACCN
jgi:copper chaperone CopZ